MAVRALRDAVARRAGTGTPGGVPPQRAGAGPRLAAGELANGGGAQHPDAVQLALAGHHRREAGQVVRGGEEPGVAGQAAQAAGDRVVHEAAVGGSLPSRGAGAAHAPLAHQPDGGGHLQRLEDATVQQAVQRLAGGSLGGGVQHHEPHVGVLHPHPRRSGEGRAEHREQGLLGGAARGPRSGGEAGGVREEVPDGHALLPRAGELREVRLDGVVQPHPPVLHEQHHGRGGADHLGERGEVVHRAVRVHRLLARAGPPEALLQHHVPPAPDRERGPGERAPRDLVPHRVAGAEERRIAHPGHGGADELVPGHGAGRGTGTGNGRVQERPQKQGGQVHVGCAGPGMKSGLSRSGFAV